jgi:aminoglycoside phosphotransferase (APT) family kinase protein
MSRAPAMGDLGFDLQGATEWISGLNIGAEPPLSFSPVGQGRSNLTFEVRDTAGRRWILRRAPLGQRLASAHDVAREYHVLSRLTASGVPAPAALGLCTDAAVTDAPLFLMGFVDGVVVDEGAARNLTPAQRRRMGLALPDALARIHDVDLMVAGLTDFASHKPYAGRQIRRWRSQWASTRTRDLRSVDELATRLERAAPPQRQVALVHGDFHILNVIFDATTPAVRAVVDWELCTLGEPLADLGGLLAYWPEHSERTGPGVFGISAMPGFPSRAELVEAYARTSGRDVSRIDYWEALACWKVAVIAEGILWRRRARETSAPGDGERAIDATLVDGMLERAAAIARDAGI